MPARHPSCAGGSCPTSTQPSQTSTSHPAPGARARSTCAYASIDARHTEAAVIVATASHIYALALRLEEYRGRWMATALELA